jgi:hypothetical protein
MRWLQAEWGGVAVGSARGMGHFPTMALDEAPSGMPPDEPEEQPLGVPDTPPEEDEPEHGPAAMPGIPSEQEPPAAS